GIARIGKKAKKKKRMPYSYAPSKTILRYTALVIFAVALIAHIPAVAALLDPYAIYGRIANTLWLPVWQMGNNLLATLAERMDSYAFYQTDVWMKGLPTLVVAVVSIVVVGVLSFMNGRTYCNTICPVGTLLGLIARRALYRIQIDENNCNGCMSCARNCKAACINIPNKQIDHTRCVSCFNCLGKCKQDAIHYTLTYKKRGMIADLIPTSTSGLGTSSSMNSTASTNADSAEATTTQKNTNNQASNGRRNFIATSVLLAGASIKAQVPASDIANKVDGGLAEILDKKIPQRETPITPPGSLSARNMKAHCTACQLCVTACPNQVLRPSSKLENFMQPEMSYERGYCRPECTKCSEVCPAGAIKRITTEDKSATQIGHAVWNRTLCVPLTNGDSCGNCARHCPTGAISMIASGQRTPKIPAVDVERCIGCGACEQVCPSRPYSAIYVEGHKLHKLI
ncbi:MAG: 4Fe-4S binding protein, partial [Phocaeicola sp.]